MPVGSRRKDGAAKQHLHSAGTVSLCWEMASFAPASRASSASVGGQLHSKSSLVCLNLHYRDRATDVTIIDLSKQS